LNEARIIKEKEFIARKFLNHSLEETQQASSNGSDCQSEKLQNSAVLLSHLQQSNL